MPERGQFLPSFVCEDFIQGRFIRRWASFANQPAVTVKEHAQHCNIRGEAGKLPAHHGIFRQWLAMACRRIGIGYQLPQEALDFCAL